MPDEMLTRLNRTREYTGYFLSIFSIALIVLGLTIYLSGPTKVGVTPWEFKESHTMRVRPHEFADCPFQLSLPEAQSLILPVKTNTSIVVKDGQGIKAYFMNATQYDQLRNDTGLSEEIEKLTIELDNISFRPRFNVTCYLILTNISNETATATVQTNTLYTIQVFDYDFPFNGLKCSIIGGAIFAMTFALGNPLDKLLRKGLRLPIFPGVKIYLTEKETGPTIAWIGLGIVTLLIIFVLSFLLNEVIASGLPSPLIPLIQDVLIRLGLFVFFAGALMFAAIIVSDFGERILRNFLYWFFGVRYRRTRDVKLEENIYTFWWKEMVSPLSLTLYGVIAILSLGIYRYAFAHKDIFVLLIVVLVPLTSLGAYNLSVSYRKARITESEFEQMRFFIHVDFISVMLSGALFFLMWFFSWNLSLNTIYANTVGSSVLVSSAESVSEFLRDFPSVVLSAINNIKGGLVLFFEGLFVATLSLFFFLSHPVKTYEAKMKILLKELQIFLFTFFSVQFILAISQQSLVTATVTSLVVSLTISFVRISMGSSWRHIVTEPRQCRKCGKNLSSFPEDTSFCPYCGEALDLLKK